MADPIVKLISDAIAENSEMEKMSKGRKCSFCGTESVYVVAMGSSWEFPCEKAECKNLAIEWIKYIAKERQKTSS